MLSDFNTRARMVCDCEQAAINLLEHRSKQGHASPRAEAEYHVQGYAGEGKPPRDLVIWCGVSTTKNGGRRHVFRLNGQRMARHRIAQHLGEMGA